METKTPEYNARAMTYYWKHRDESLARRKQRRADHVEEEREKAKARYRINCEKIKANAKAYRETHPEVQRAYREKNKEKRKIQQRVAGLRRWYGITLEEYNAIFEKQGHKCAICGLTQDTQKKIFAVDHDHITGKIRGILCSRCNSLLGFAEDKPELLISAINYIGKYKDDKNV